MAPNVKVRSPSLSVHHAQMYHTPPPSGVLRAARAVFDRLRAVLGRLRAVLGLVRARVRRAVLHVLQSPRVPCCACRVAHSACCACCMLGVLKFYTCLRRSPDVRVLGVLRVARVGPISVACWACRVGDLCVPCRVGVPRVPCRVSACRVVCLRVVFRVACRVAGVLL